MAQKPSQLETDLNELNQGAPKPLAHIVGQDGPLHTLCEAVRCDRVHHAWIFHGPKGVGKFTTALSFAALLLNPTTTCTADNLLAADPDDHTSKLLNAGTHPDLHIICKELARFSDDRQIREAKQMSIPKKVIEQYLLVPASLAPSMNTGSRASKVFIIDEADLLDRSQTNAPVQNAMLKTLEEPSPGTVMILVTDREQKLLPTVRSRCQRIAFSSLSDQSMQLWLRSSGLEVSPGDVDWLLRFVAGSPGEFVQAVQTGLIAWQRTMEPMLRAMDQGNAPMDLGSTMATLIDQWAADYVAKHRYASKDAANKHAAGLMLNYLSSTIRHQLKHDAIQGDISAMHRRTGMIDRIHEAELRLGSNVQIGLVMEALAASLSCPVEIQA